MKSIVPLNPNKHYGPDHHIWDNNGTWWCHFSVPRRRGRAKRMRISLATSDRKEARLRRDQIMKATPERATELQEKWRRQRAG